MKHLFFLIVAVMLCSLTIKAQSTNDNIVLDCRGANKVIPYGRSKILTITDVKVNEYKEVTLSYKLENKMTEKPVLASNFTEGNITCGINNFYVYANGLSQITYMMNDKTITFIASPSQRVSGSVLVRVFLIWRRDQISPFMAISNVASLKIDF